MRTIIVRTFVGIVLTIVVPTVILYAYKSTYISPIIQVKANMLTVQIGIDKYAKDHKGRYPSTLGHKMFSWETYIPYVNTQGLNARLDGKPLISPYDSNIGGSSLIEETIITTDPIARRQAYRDFRTFRHRGTIRYYVNKAQADYALTASDEKREPLRWATAGGDRINYVVPWKVDK